MINEAKRYLAKEWCMKMRAKYLSNFICCGKRESFSKVNLDSPGSDDVETGDNGRMKVNLDGNYNGDFVHSSVVNESDESTYLSSPGIVECKDCSEGVSGIEVNTTAIIRKKQFTMFSVMNMTVEELTTITKDNLIELLCLLRECHKANIEKINRVNEIAKQLEAVSVKSTYDAI